MKNLIFIFLLLNFVFINTGFAKERTDEVIHIIRKSTHLGAHGMGYNSKSLVEMSKKLKASDTDIIFELYKNRIDYKNKNHLSSTAISFALASLCDAGLIASEKAFKEKQMDALDYQDTLNLISGFDVCSIKTRDQAKALLPLK